MQGRGSAQYYSGSVLSLYRASLAQTVVAQVFGVPLADMRAPTRSRPRAALARQVAMYLSHVVFGMSVIQVASAFERDRSTACHAMRHVEELREDPELDRTVDYLETLLRGVVEIRT
jgi:chromosomal replication initiation ATPase DnaA